MDKIRISGGAPLRGDIDISGAKNAALPLMATALLTDQPVTLRNVPRLADIQTMTSLLEQHGVQAEEVAQNGAQLRGLRLSTPAVKSVVAPYDIVRKMRASVLVLGPLLARERKAEVSLPGGCAIGARPVDLHIQALEALGAEIEVKNGYLHARAPNGLVGARFIFPKVSVGATENALMAASLAKGQTVLANAAREPEIVDLAHCLNAMGAKISGIGTDRLTIDGVEALGSVDHQVVSDRIEAGTFAMAAAVSGGDVTLKRVKPELLESMINLLRPAGVLFEANGQDVRVSRPGPLAGVDVMTEPYPGFPTDLQAQMMGLMSVANGASMITETIFENRFMHVPELVRMGADITIHGRSALVRGVTRLTGAPVMATDLRASVSLVIAGLVAEGETVINRVYHLDRGYEQIERKLAGCGAHIERIAD
ncbi:MAG: UDP-N-acetylglucosamine 1-carboxyvinyltransferase [Pseudomonadota bacterium]